MSTDTIPVFLSHSAEDQELADLVRSVLHLPGDVPQAGASGQDLRKLVQARIAAADQVVVLWTPAAARSQWVSYEIGMADALGKRLLVVARDDASVTEAPSVLRDAEWLRFDELGKLAG